MVRIEVNTVYEETEMRDQIERGLLKLGVRVPDPFAIDKLIQFVDTMLEQNKVMNLTAIKEPSQVVGLHLLDSAVVANFVPQGAKTLLDFGTGAGFPGIPLKILLPHLDVTLMDALEKRLHWLDVVSQELDLENIQTLHGRGEDLPHLGLYRERYDVVTSRAVAELRILTELALPFVKVDGTLLAMKSRDTGGEIQRAEETIKLMGGVITEVTDYQIPDMDVCYRMVVIDKVAPTPEDYPRRWKKIKSTPIS